MTASFGTHSTAEAEAVMEPTMEPTTAPSVDPTARARSLRANEMGQVIVLMYHLIGYGESRYNRTPEAFRQDIADLKAAG